MEIEPTVTVAQWVENAEKANTLLDAFVDTTLEALGSAGFWGTVGATVLFALKFVPHLAPQYSVIASLVGKILAPKVHTANVKAIQEQSGHFVTMTEVLADVSAQLPQSNGIGNVNRILADITDSKYFAAVKNIVDKKTVKHQVKHMRSAPSIHEAHG